MKTMNDQQLPQQPPQQPIIRRKKSPWPATLFITKPTRNHPGGCEFVPNEDLEEYYKKHGLLQPAPEPASAPHWAAPSEPQSAQPSATPDSTSPTEPATEPASVADPNDASLSHTPHRPRLARHARKCCICSHRDREDIEDDFIDWRRPDEIARNYQISQASIYRHARATGLFPRRKRELSRALENIIESSDDCSIEWAEVITRAARVYAHLDDADKWFEPTRTNLILTGPAPISSQGIPQQNGPELEIEGLSEESDTEDEEGKLVAEEAAQVDPDA